MGRTLLEHTVLYVEDDQDTRRNYMHYFTRRFARVYEAADGIEGLRRYNEHKPAILIVDIEMPEGDGLELVQKIREHDKSIKVIVLTAHSDVSRLLKATELGLTKYLVKPVGRDELKEALSKAVSELTEYQVVRSRILSLREGYFWNADDRVLSRNGKAVILTKKEMQLFAFLMRHPNRTFAYDELIFELWESFDTQKNEPLKTIIKTLRKKLPEGVLQNVYGIGYQLCC